MPGGRFAENCSIAGIALTDLSGRPARVEIEANDLNDDLSGNTVAALDATPWTQLNEIGGRDRRVAFNCLQLPASTVNAIRAAVQQAKANNSTVHIIGSDDVVSVNHDAVADDAAGWFTKQSQSSGYIRGVVFRFRTVQP